MPTYNACAARLCQIGLSVSYATKQGLRTWPKRDRNVIYTIKPDLTDHKRTNSRVSDNKTDFQTVPISNLVWTEKFAVFVLFCKSNLSWRAIESSFVSKKSVPLYRREILWNALRCETLLSESKTGMQNALYKP